MTDRRLGITVGRNGIFIGTPRVLDVTWGSGLLVLRTYRFFLRLRPFKIGRTSW